MTESEPQGPVQPVQSVQSEQPEQPAKKVMRLEEKFPRALWVRLIIYVAVGHIFAAFIYLLFELGAQNQ